MEYEVTYITDTHLEVRKLHPDGDEDKHGKPFIISHEEVAKRMRLQHALCYYTSQGRTFRDGPCVLLDTTHPHFTKRHLIVGLSRCGEGCDVYIK